MTDDECFELPPSECCDGDKKRSKALKKIDNSGQHPYDSSIEA
jgi:hypothetical protein